MTIRELSQRRTMTRTPQNVQIVIDRDYAIVKTDDRQLQAQLRDALQTIRTSYEVTPRGLKMSEEIIDFAFNEDGFNVAPTLVPRLVKTAIEAGVPVTLKRGGDRLDVPTGEFRRRGAALAMWNLELMRFSATGVCGQYVSASPHQAAGWLTKWIDQHAEASWMLIVPNDQAVQRWNRLIAARHPGRERTGSGLWQSRPYQAIVAAKDAPVESARINFQQVFVIGGRCMLTDSLRELHEDVRVPIALIRSRYEHYSAAEELLLERLAGPVVLPDYADPTSRTVVIRLATPLELTPDTLAGSLQHLHNTLFDQGDNTLPRSMTIVMRTFAAAVEYREKLFQIPHPTQGTLKYAVMTLEDLVMKGLPAGIVVFGQDTANWLSTRGRFPLRGSKLRIVIDASGSTGARYDNDTLTIYEVPM